MMRLAFLTIVTAAVGVTVSVTVLPRPKPGQFETPPPVEIVAVTVPEKQPADEKNPVTQEQVKLDEIEVRLRHLTEQAARIERKAEARAEGE